MGKLIIIGGGIQGCTLAVHLLKTQKIKKKDLMIIDKNAKPLQNWTRCTETISMPYLRSPSVHHLDLNPFSLEKFLKREDYNKGHFYGYYDRPSLEMFNHHCQSLIDEVELMDCWQQSSVNGLERNKNHWVVRTDEGKSYKSEKIVLAIGLSEHPFWPEWAYEAKVKKASIHHVFQKDIPDFNKLDPAVTVVGGGITAAHLTLKLMTLFPGEVTMIYRKELQIHTFDSDPGWQGPMYMENFQKTKDYQSRRKMIFEARHKGSITKELYHRLRKAEKEGKIQLVKDEVTSFSVDTNTMHFQSGLTQNTGTIILATGFHSAPPGIDWLENTINQERLHCAECGYPIVSPATLEWGEELFVMGPLAELEIGPVARNIAGARRAVSRILQAI
ncbi:NAD(P)-binding domain-containing protein [Fictibacillus nanhaiensis]|uniref:NAD(P)-binding domain-containing protein n=1 Tax=Fictibacillus nanhaiensis TaxID=742169 RepID=UPI00203C34C5|nr:NAD(P)-binding domain-containing protein [Fictibacillus nanhaiensis]MCM3731186.1 NAD(P)-binding domain-containing protein [Fictibacillus nanhaiensis]